MQPPEIALGCQESQHGTRKGGLIPYTTHLAEVLGTTHEVHFTRRVSPDRIIEGVVCHFCLSEGNDILNCIRDLSFLQKGAARWE